jgi:hypothetical protein
MAAYAERGRSVDFFEIDSVVARIAEDRRLFSYLSAARERGAHARIALGDARPTLAGTSARFDLLVLDAFGSDAIPVHLLTREALRLYFAVLRPHGVVALHISNRYLRLEPVVANLAADGGYARLLQHGDSGGVRGGVSASWVLLARQPADLGALASDSRWTEASLDPDPRVGTWTDDFHNLLAVLKW